MSINLNQLVQGALTESVLQQLAGRVGCAPALARSLFAAIMASPTNAHIEQESPHFVVHNEGFKTLIKTSEHADGALTSHESLSLLSDRITEHTGVATSATRTISGMVAPPHWVCSSAISRSITATSVSCRYAARPSVAGGARQHDRRVCEYTRPGLGRRVSRGRASRLTAVSSHLEHPATQHAAAFPLQVETPPPVEHPVAEDKHNRKAWI